MYFLSETEPRLCVCTCMCMFDLIRKESEMDERALKEGRWSLLAWQCSRSMTDPVTNKKWKVPKESPRRRSSDFHRHVYVCEPLQHTYFYPMYAPASAHTL